MLPDAVKKFIDIVSRLPSIGPRQATRLAFNLIGFGGNEVSELADAVSGLTSLKRCPACFFIHDNNEKLCLICANPARKKDIIMVVEKETDLLSLEKTGRFQGCYLIIGDLKKTGLLSTEQKLKIASLKSRIESEFNGQIKEIVLAINPTAYGDAGAFLLKQELKDSAKKITRLGRGIPTGGEIEFADEETLGEALNNRS